LSQLTALPQVPVLLHVWTPLFKHCVDGGAHSTHAPFKHAGSVPVHVVGELHWPVESQVWTLGVPPVAHCTSPGLHIPVHAPLLQTYWQPTGGPNELPVQVSTPLFEHCVLPASHEL
jgi:hypothetical protein